MTMRCWSKPAFERSTATPRSRRPGTRVPQRMATQPRPGAWIRSSDDVPTPELGEHHFGQRFGRCLARLQIELGLLGRLVARIDPREVADQTGPGFAIKPLRVA